MRYLKIKNLYLVFFILVSTINLGYSQDEKELLATLVEEEQEAINALVLYPEETRRVILEVTQYPEALIKIESIQRQTSDSFIGLLEDLPQETQKMVWDLTRYPGLIEALSALGTPTRSAINDVLEDYPDVIESRAREAAMNYYPLLVEINELNQSAESAFAAILYNYPAAAQDNFRELLALPEVLTILTENIRLTILVGDLYSKEPEWVIQKADSLSLEVARQNAEELEAWKEELQNDPEAREEFQLSAESYAKEYGYEDEYYEYDDVYYDYEQEPQREEVIVRHYYYHYPYWFGYPRWYVYPRWRLYPMWYDWGFYFGPGRRVVVIGLPSFHFTHWYFHHSYHHIYYPHLSARFVRHYDRYRDYNSSINNGVVVWAKRNRAVITNRWMQSDNNLPKRFVEYGKYEVARTEYNQDHPQRQLSQTEYLNRYDNRYPDLAKTVREAKPEERVISREPMETRKRTIEPERRYPTTRKEPTTRSRTEKEPDKKVERKTIPPRTMPKVNRGKEHHENTWEKTKRTRSTTPPSTIKRSPPKTTTTPPKTRTRVDPKKTVKRKKKNNN